MLQWKDIEGYEGLYKVSNDGRVWSIKSNKEMKIQDNKGYSIVCLRKDGKKKNCRVHRLVAQAFIPNPEDKPQVNHIDEDRSNNHVTNLEWATASENINHGTRNIKHAEKLSVPINQYNMNGEFIKSFTSYTAVEKELGFNRTNVRNCAYGKHKHSYGFIWKHAN